VNDIQVSRSEIQKVKGLVDEIREELETSKISTETYKKIEEIKEILKSKTQNSSESFAMAAQVSLYPLHVPSLSPFINDVLRIFQDLKLDIIPGSMSTVVYGDSQTLWQALEKAFASTVEMGEVVMTVTVSNACPIPASLK
jgi:uncharacterized protein YqgV (UPF0045/DUF77 family)